MSSCFCTGACREPGGSCSSMQQFPGGDGNAKLDLPKQFSLDEILKRHSIAGREHTGAAPTPTSILSTHIFSPYIQKQAEPREAPGFHPVEAPKACLNMSHNFPTMLYVPPGMKYVHYCPGCGQKTVVTGGSVTC
jgi:hypothetical protein